MMKREANGFAESSRSKRPRRDREAVGHYSSDEPDAAMQSDNGASDGEGSGRAGVSMPQSEVRRHGLHIWQTVVNAVSKECVCFPCHFVTILEHLPFDLFLTLLSITMDPALTSGSQWSTHVAHIHGETVEEVISRLLHPHPAPHCPR